MNLSIIKITFVLLVTMSVTACNKKKQPEVPKAPPIDANIAIADVSSNNCLNVEKVLQRIQDKNFTAPAAVMTTNLKNISEISKSKLEFFSYATFNYKEANANDLEFLTQAKQNECQTIELLSASKEVLTYRISEHSDRFIKFRLQNSYRADLSDTEKKAMYERIQPYEYTIVYLSERSLKIIEKYQSVDPLCQSKTYLDFEVEKNISWAPTTSELPSAYEINPDYLSLVRNAINTEVTSSTTVVSGTVGILSKVEIEQIMNTPPRDELKLCN